MENLSIYSSDSSFNGIVVMNGANSKINLVRVAKDRVSEFSTSMNKPGIYLLLIGTNCIYVGQTGLSTIDKRIMSTHSGSIDSDWHTVLSFACINPTISTNQLLYMENAMCEYVYKNYPYCATTSPAKAYCNARYRKEHYGLSIGQTVECDQCLADMQEYIRLFPKGIFPEGSPDTPEKYTSGGGTSVPGPMESAIGVPLFAKQRSADAEGYLTSDGKFILKKGSFITPKEPTSTCPQSTRNRLLVEAGNLVGNKVLNDLVFSSPSAAACFVAKASMNGNDVWRSANGTKLIDLIDFFGSSLSDEPQFGPAPSTVTGVVAETDETDANADVAVLSAADYTTLYCKGRGANAKGYVRADGKFIVLADSFVTPLDFTASCPTGT